MSINNSEQLDDQQIQDPTTQGIDGLDGLKGINNSEEDSFYDQPIFRLANSYRNTINWINRNTSPTQEIGFVGLNESIYDREISSATQLENLENTRAEIQPWYAQVGAGLAKGAALAGTTFLDGTIGLVLGGAKAIKEGRVSALWDNEFGFAMQEINDAVAKALPNYYTDDEKNSPWYENIFTANFLGDKILSTMGFAVGAYFSGGLHATAAKATRLPQLIGKLTKSTKAPSIIASGVGTTASSVSEARMEALSGATEWFEEEKAKLDKEHAQRMKDIYEFKFEGSEVGSSGIEGITGDSDAQKLNETLGFNRDFKKREILLQNEKEAYNAALAKLTENRLKMGNATMLMNTAVILPSNISQFGKLYARGFKTASRTSRLAGKAGEYTTKKTIGKGIAKAASMSLTEGLEEMSQKAAVNVAGDYYSNDTMNFYASKINPDAEQETVNWIKSFAKGINETVNDGSSWEEFFIGSLIGAAGMPRFRGIKSNESKIQSPIILEGGTHGTLKDYLSDMRSEQELANKINERVQSPEFLNYYRGLIRHNKYQNDMNLAVENDDEFEYKNSEYSQLISDIMMFDNAGKIGDLISLIDSSFDTSDKNLEAIANNIAASTNNEGKKVKKDPFIDENGNPMYSTPEGKKEMINKLTKEKDEFLETINDYVKIKRDIDILSGQQLNDEQLEELTWLKAQRGNWDKRAGILSSEIKGTLNNILHENRNYLVAKLNFKKAENNKNNSRSNTTTFEEEKKIAEINELINIYSSLSNLNFGKLLAEDSKLLDFIKNTFEDPMGRMSAEDIKSYKKKADDVVKLINNSNKFNNKFKEYIENPERLQKDIDSTAEKIINKETNKKSSNLKDRLQQSNNISEFRKIFNEEEDDSIKENILKSLEKENSKIAKEYKEIEDYYKEMAETIISSNEDSDIKDSALNILKNKYDKANSFEEISNTDISDVIDDLNYNGLSIQDAIKKSQKIQHLFISLKAKILEKKNFKQSFSSTQEKPNKKGKPNPNAPKNNATGKDETSTIPSINKTTSKKSPIEKKDNYIIEDITQEEVKEENIENNNSTESQLDFDNKQEGKRKYYRPAIPELHITGSQQGDFRPFNIVASEKNPELNFDEIYNYLKQNGAFNYVNEGNLKPGDELGFMIDPAFNENTVFLIDKRNNQIVGSLDESEYSVKKFEGLDILLNKVRIEFKQNGDKNKRFIASPVTKVSQIMVGKIPYDTQENSLKDIPNISENPIIGIVKKSIVDTNGAIDNNLIIGPLNISNKEGRIYLLIPNANGKYSPAAIRVKHFNKKEFNPENIEVQNTKVYKDIQKAANNLAQSVDETELNDAFINLKSVLYVGDLHVDWFDSEKSSGIRFTKVQKDENGNEIYEEKDGKRLRKENIKLVFLTQKIKTNDGEFIKTLDTELVSKRIIESLLDFDLPIQINYNELNKGNYNRNIIDSNVLTSNISDARVIGSWFTTDYFNEDGSLHKANNPASLRVNPYERIMSSVVEDENIKEDVTLDIGGITYTVDLTNNNIYDSNNQIIYPKNAELIKDIAWANNTYGTITEGSLLWNNKILLPSGKVLDRTTNKYLTGKEAEEVKDRLANKESTLQDSERILNEIYENQEKVDKTRTDSEFYYILEEDGIYHKYSRVHSKIGSNYINSQEEKLIKDNSNSNKFLQAGSTIDNVIRNFFTSNNTPIKPDNLEEEAFKALIESLTEIRNNIENRGERFLTNNIVLFHKYPDGTRIAGEVDILSIDTNGNFKIYDVKTSQHSFYKNRIYSGKEINSFTDISNKQIRSTKDYYTLQLSAYKNLFESQYNTPITLLGILPFVLTYNGNNISNIEKENGIIINYNPNVNVPLDSSTWNISPVNIIKESESTLPIFNSTLETMNPINVVLPELSLEDGKVGYYVYDDKLYKGYLSYVGKVNSVDIYMTKFPYKFTSLGPNKNGRDYFYLEVYPNGKTVNLPQNLLGDIKKDITEKDIKEIIKENISHSSVKLSDLTNEKTIIYDPSSTTQSSPMRNILSSIVKQEKANNDDSDFEDDIILGELRKVDDESRRVWNIEKEISWLKKALPQLSNEDRLKIVKGLIKVGKKGTLAWGQFNDGIITLSDIAAEGTIYHEAFHAVFHLLLDQNERISLLNEYKEKNPNMDDLNLEEELAEDFREFVMQGGKNNRNLGRKIIDFFKSLFIKTKYWKDFRPSSVYYFRAINEGKYFEENIPTTISGSSRYKQEEYTQEMKDILAKAPRDRQGRLLAPNGKPSNLTERQWLQVRTKAFKEWFGDWLNRFIENPYSSDIKIELTYDYDSMDAVGPGALLGIIYKDENFIGQIPLDAQIGKNGLEYYHSLPFVDISSIGNEVNIDKKYRNKGYGKASYIEAAKWAISQSRTLRSAPDGSRTEDSNRVWKSLERDGYATKQEFIDHFGNKEYRYVINNNKLLDPNISKVIDENGEPYQIKSVIDNIGTFNKESNNIRYRKIPNISFETIDSNTKELLMKKGWTKEKFDSISQQEREQAIKCIEL